MLFLMKFQIMGTARLLNDEVKRNSRWLHCNSYLRWKISDLFYAILSLPWGQATVGHETT